MVTGWRICYVILVTVSLAFGVAARAQTQPMIALTVDARQAPERIIRTEMVIPVKPGPLTLYYPKWRPGEFQPDRLIANIAGLKFTANGKTIPWTRDLLDVCTFHLSVPEGVTHLDVSFQYLQPQGWRPYSIGISATDKLADIEWNQYLLYLAGVRAQDQTFDATLVLPDGWKFGTPLPVEKQDGGRVTFKPVPLNRLVDSPVIAGQYYREINLTPPGEPIRHEIDIVADSAEALDMSPKVRRGLTNLVAESGKLFGARHYRDYHFLLTLSNNISGLGLEHHESNDSRLPERTLLEPNAAYRVGSILAHEFVHSWNGKFRRPVGLNPPYYETPEKTNLIWVYEGLTDYLGHVLATRSGLWTRKEYHQFYASIGAELGPGRPGRTWRPLQDTANAVPGMIGLGGGWMNWIRGRDYYREGDLLWLEVATIIGRQTHGKKSFDDFCKLFYGGPNQGPQLKRYTFDDLVNTLKQVAPYDWSGFFRERLDSTLPEAPLGGVEASGWKLVYNDRPTGPVQAQFRRGVNAAYSIGLMVGNDGDVIDSIWNGPAFKAGVTPGMTVVGVNGRVFTSAVLEYAIKASRESTQPIRLLVVNDDYYKTRTIDYHGGARYPHLVRESGKPDYLDSEIVRPRTPHE
ncbi:MAG: M61 family metallopeptidase [Candidatus Acidiferrales bacterium]